VQPNLLLQKDKLIESLRLDLAESQIRLVEADHHGGTKLQELEQQLLEVRMTNARLMEDNESFQLLLSSAALNGDFPRGDYLTNAFSDAEQDADEAASESNEEVKKVPGSPRRGSISLGLNLADELVNSVADDPDVQEENQQIKKLEGELKGLREQNKAMSLYISGIIERILQSKDSEAILDKTTTPVDNNNNTSANTEKPLPPKPEEQPRTAILQRTTSMAPRRAPPPFRPENMQRSQSYRGPSGGHKRTQSDIGHSNRPGSVNNIYRGEGMITPRTSTFYGGATGERYTRSTRTRDSVLSIDSGVADSDTSSISSRTSSHPSTPVLAGKQLRPLTLVQKNVSNGMMSPPLSGRKISGDYMDGDYTTSNKRSSKRGSWYVPSWTPSWNRRRGSHPSPLDNNTVDVNDTDLLFARMGWFGRKEDAVQAATQSVVFEGKDVE
jgi:hypothetical protein